MENITQDKSILKASAILLTTAFKTEYVLRNSALFRGLTSKEIEVLLGATPHHVRKYEKGEIIFHLMDPAEYVGIVLEGKVQAQKSFPNGSQINVSVKGPGEMIGPAAAFSAQRRYPCDMMVLEPASVLIFRHKDVLTLMQKDLRILENFTVGIASAAYMLQQRLELLSYSGIAQKAAFYLLMQSRQSGSLIVSIPGSVTKWAMLMNVSRPSLHRELTRLEKEGIIAYTPPVISIFDWRALENMLSS